MFKCELSINSQTYDVTNDLKNWDDFALAQKRSSYDGVMRTFSTQFEFVKKAYNLLKNEYYTKYLNAEATVVFSLRNNSWEYDEIFRCALDFSTYSEDGLTISINAIDNTLAAIIKAKKSIQYEYPISDIYTSVLKYDGLKFQYAGKFTLGASSYESDGVQYVNVNILTIAATYSLPLYKLSNSELPSLDSPLLFNDSPGEWNVDLSTAKPFLKALSDIHIDLKFRTDYYATNYSGEVQKIRLVFGIKNPDGGTWEVKSYESDGFYRYIDETIPIDLTNGQTLCFVMVVTFKNVVIPKNNADIVFPNFSISVDFDSRINSVDIDVISPITVLNKILDSMTETTDTYYGVIDDYDPRMSLDRLSTVYIMAAESTRGIPNAKLYTSYKKYCDWMEAEFGYVPVISENEVTFMHRDKLFTPTIVKELGKKINDYEMTVNSGLIYSSVKVGYDKQDYDSINGRDEFRFTNEFSTGLKITDNTLSLISPYRADAYGIEFLVQKRGEDTTDSSSDNDVFFVSCDRDGVNLKLYRPYKTSQISGLISPDTMFNFRYSPRFMLEANKKYIGACTSLLKFASSDGNSDVSIDGMKETADMAIPERLFSVSEVEVSTNDLDVPGDLTGLISFNNRGEIVSGYIKQLKLNIAKEKAATYTLIVKDIKS